MVQNFDGDSFQNLTILQQLCLYFLNTTDHAVIQVVNDRHLENLFSKVDWIFEMLIENFQLCIILVALWKYISSI